MARPTTSLLTQDQIVHAALEMVKRSGNFTISSLAARLKVHSSSLYHHIPGGRSEIVTLIRAELYSSLPIETLTDRSTPWVDRLREWALTYRHLSAQAPWIVPVVIGQPVRDNPTLAIYETLFTLLRETDLPKEQYLPVAAMLDIIVLGSALDASSPAPLWPDPPADYPNLAAAITSRDTEERKLEGLHVAIEAAIQWIEMQSSHYHDSQP